MWRRPKRRKVLDEGKMKQYHTTTKYKRVRLMETLASVLSQLSRWLYNDMRCLYYLANIN